MRVATLRELRDALIAYCKQYPDIADETVNVGTEGGWTGAYIASPVILYKSKGDESVSIYTDDDWNIEDKDRFVVYKMT